MSRVIRYFTTFQVLPGPGRRRALGLVLVLAVIVAYGALYLPIGSPPPEQGTAYSVRYFDTDRGDLLMTAVTDPPTPEEIANWTLRNELAEHLPVDLIHTAGASVGVDSASTATWDFQASERNAWASANRALGNQVTYGILVSEVVPGSEADEHGVVAGDSLVIDHPVAVSSPGSAWARLAPAGPIPMVLWQDGSPVRTVSFSSPTVEGAGIACATDGAQCAGIGTVAPDLPHPDRFRFQDGGSAGLMLTLAYLEVLTDTPLSGDLVVAGTGTVSWDNNRPGEVGGVAGIGLKGAAALDAGADVFFTPLGQGAEAPAALRIVEVGTVFDATDWLCANTKVPADLCTQIAGHRNDRVGG